MFQLIFLFLKKVSLFGRDTPAVLVCLFKHSMGPHWETVPDYCALVKAMSHALSATHSTVPLLLKASPFRRAGAEGRRTGGEVCICHRDERRREESAGRQGAQ